MQTTDSPMPDPPADATIDMGTLSHGFGRPEAGRLKRRHTVSLGAAAAALTVLLAATHDLDLFEQPDHGDQHEEVSRPGGGGGGASDWI
jgi:hypothetical protein